MKKPKEMTKDSASDNRLKARGCGKSFNLVTGYVINNKYKTVENLCNEILDRNSVRHAGSRWRTWATKLTERCLSAQMCHVAVLGP